MITIKKHRMATKLLWLAVGAVLSLPGMASEVMSDLSMARYTIGGVPVAEDWARSGCNAGGRRRK
jgi:hypothetical protein